MAIESRHEQWAKQMPKDEKDLWATLQSFDADSRMAMFAHCAALTVDAVREPWNRAEGRKRHADQLAEALALDMAAKGWRPTSSQLSGARVEGQNAGSRDRGQRCFNRRVNRAAAQARYGAAGRAAARRTWDASGAPTHSRHQLHDVFGQHHRGRIPYPARSCRRTKPKASFRPFWRMPPDPFASTSS